MSTPIERRPSPRDFRPNSLEARQAAREFLDITVRNRRRAPGWLRTIQVFDDLPEDPSAEQMFRALKGSGMWEEIFEFLRSRSHSPGQRPNSDLIKKTYSYALAKLGEGDMVDFTREGEDGEDDVVVGMRDVVELSRFFTADSDRISRPQGLIVNRSGSIIAAFTTLFFLSPGQVEAAVSGMREHVRRFGDICVKKPALFIITPSTDTDVAEIIRGFSVEEDLPIKHIALPMSAVDIDEFTKTEIFDMHTTEGGDDVSRRRRRPRN